MDSSLARDRDRRTHLPPPSELWNHARWLLWLEMRSNGTQLAVQQQCLTPIPGNETKAMLKSESMTLAAH